MKEDKYVRISGFEAKKLVKEGKKVQYYDNRQDNVFEGYIDINNESFYFSMMYLYRTKKKNIAKSI